MQPEQHKHYKHSFHVNHRIPYKRNAPLAALLHHLTLYAKRNDYEPSYVKLRKKLRLLFAITLFANLATAYITYWLGTYSFGTSVIWAGLIVGLVAGVISAIYARSILMQFQADSFTAQLPEKKMQVQNDIDVVTNH